MRYRVSSCVITAGTKTWIRALKHGSEILHDLFVVELIIKDKTNQKSSHYISYFTQRSVRIPTVHFRETRCELFTRSVSELLPPEDFCSLPTLLGVRAASQ